MPSDLEFEDAVFVSPTQLKWAEGSRHVGFAMSIVILRVGSERIRLSRFINFIFALKTGLEYLQCNYKNVLKLRRRENTVVDVILMIVWMFTVPWPKKKVELFGPRFSEGRQGGNRFSINAHHVLTPQRYTIPLGSAWKWVASWVGMVSEALIL